MDIKPPKDRSPRCPRITLEKAIHYTRAIHQHIGKSKVKLETTLSAIGHKKITGDSLLVFSSVSQYGLVIRGGGNIEVSPLALMILHPPTDSQRASAIVTAALSPATVRQIRKEFHSLSAEALANQLVQMRFTPDGAKRTAEIYKANADFADLESVNADDIPSVPQEPKNRTKRSGDKSASNQRQALDDAKKGDSEGKSWENPLWVAPTSSLEKKRKILPVPLGNGDSVQIPHPISEDDFDLLLQTLKLWKKRIVES